MARPERFELPTFWFVAIAAPRISELHRALPLATECHRCRVQQGFPEVSKHSVTLGRVWWWAQNWAHSSLRSSQRWRDKAIFQLGEFPIGCELSYARSSEAR